MYLLLINKKNRCPICEEFELKRINLHEGPTVPDEYHCQHCGAKFRETKNNIPSAYSINED